MVRTVGYKDPGRLELISELNKVSSESGSKLWTSVAEELSRVRKNRRQVNVFKIDKNAGDGDVVVVPGKVLGDGILSHKVDVAAYKFTEGAKRKITQAGGKTMTILQLAKENPKGNKVKLIG